MVLPFARVAGVQARQVLLYLVAQLLRLEERAPWRLLVLRERVADGEVGFGARRLMRVDAVLADQRVVLLALLLRAPRPPAARAPRSSSPRPRTMMRGPGAPGSVRVLRLGMAEASAWLGLGLG